MKPDELKRAIIQHLVKHQYEWTRGKVLDGIFSCSERERKGAVESLHFDGWPVIADKAKGYKVSYDPAERRAYYDRREKEIKVQLASIKTLRALDESGELFAQDFVIEKEMYQSVNEL